MLYANQPHYKTSQQSQQAPGPPERTVGVQHKLTSGEMQLTRLTLRPPSQSPAQPGDAGKGWSTRNQE